MPATFWRPSSTCASPGESRTSGRVCLFRRRPERSAHASEGLALRCTSGTLILRGVRARRVLRSAGCCCAPQHAREGGGSGEFGHGQEGISGSWVGAESPIPADLEPVGRYRSRYGTDQLAKWTMVDPCSCCACPCVGVFGSGARPTFRTDIASIDLSAVRRMVQSEKAGPYNWSMAKVGRVPPGHLLGARSACRSPLFRRTLLDPAIADSGSVWSAREPGFRSGARRCEADLSGRAEEGGCSRAALTPGSPPACRWRSRRTAGRTRENVESVPLCRRHGPAAAFTLHETTTHRSVR